MTDKLTEVSKRLGKTKRDAEYALTRYQPRHPKIERTRDIFDSVIPFEMEFDIERQDGTTFMDLIFNKAPPLNCGCDGRFQVQCEEFILGAGNHLIQVTARYKPGTVTVFKNGIQLTSAEFYEYDPINGQVYISSSSTTDQVFNICYTRDTWVTCPPIFRASTFESVQAFLIGLDNDLLAQVSSHSSNGFGAFVESKYVAGFPPNDSGSTFSHLFPIPPDGFIVPPVSNVRVTHEVLVSAENMPSGGATLEGGIQISEIYWFFRQSANETGFFVSVNGGPFIKRSSATSGRVTIDRNESRGTCTLEGPGTFIEIPIGSAPNPYSPYVVSYSFSILTDDFSPGASGKGALTFYEIGCSLEAPTF